MSCWRHGKPQVRSGAGKALWKHLNQGEQASPLDEAQSRALAWLLKSSRLVSAFNDESVVCDVLDHRRPDAGPRRRAKAIDSCGA